MMAIFGNRKFLVCLCLFSLILADDGMDMNMDGPKEFHPKNAGSKTFHWLVALGVQLILPSVAAVFSIADKTNLSLFLQFVSTGYDIFDVLFLRFPDSDNVENRTSRGTAWFLAILSAATVFIGSLASGTGLLKTKSWSNSPAVVANHGRLVLLHKILSFLVTLTGWIRVSLAPVALFGFCRGVHTGQCIAHGIMGTAFILYGGVFATLLVVPWLRRGDNQKHSQEFFDSSVMCFWGIINTFTEHRWGKEPWNHGDYQHTAMGIIWWAGGLLGMWLSRNGRRSFVPAILLMFTGWAMSEHSQHSVVSTKVHAMFGLVLMSGGLVRIIEISFLLNDKRASEDGEIKSFQYFPSFCLIEAGLLFMGANEEQLELVTDLGADHSAYILTVSAGAFMIYLWMLLLLQLYLYLYGKGSSATEYAAVNEFELDNLSDDEAPLGVAEP